MSYRRATRRYDMHELPSAFTLVELLVVMAIISMLMSILLPSLNKARDAGKRVHCSANIRGLTFAWTMYANDNEDKLCFPDTGWNNLPDNYNWVADGPDWGNSDPFLNNAALNPEGGTPKAIEKGVLWSYLQSVPVYKCKSDHMKRLRSYSISATAGRAYTRLTALSPTSAKMVFIDASTGGSWIEGSFFPIFNHDWGSGIRNWSTAPQITARHSGGTNISFVDAHCEYWKWQDQRTPQFIAGKMSGEDASANTNVDVEKMEKALGYIWLGNNQCEIK